MCELIEHLRRYVWVKTADPIPTPAPPPSGLSLNIGRGPPNSNHTVQATPVGGDDVKRACWSTVEPPLNGVVLATTAVGDCRGGGGGEGVGVEDTEDAGADPVGEGGFDGEACECFFDGSDVVGFCGELFGDVA
jgi:hypothetical protein